MTLNTSKLINAKTSKEITFHKVSSITDNINIAAFSFASPGSSADNNIVSNLGGFNRLVSFDFELVNDGTDRSGGDTITTIDEQWDYIMDTIVQAPGAGNKVSQITYNVVVQRYSGTKTYTGMLEDIEISPREGDPNKILRGRLTLRIGGNNPFS